MFRSLANLALMLWSLPSGAQDPAMLRVLAEAAAENGSAWVTDTGLVVGRPEHPDRPGTRPLDAHAPVVLPGDLSAWKPVGVDCKGPLAVETETGALAIEVIQKEPIVSSVVSYKIPGAAPVRATLPVGVTPCEAIIADLGPAPGNELAAAWRIGSTFGVTVWALPVKPAAD